MHDWTDINYLQKGGPRQRAAYTALTRLGIFETLAVFNPLLAGTIPIAIDLPESDLDIVCEVHDFDAFEALLRAHYQAERGFKVEQKEKRGEHVIVCDFEFAGFPIQLFGQARPSAEQNAFRHMIIEGRLLALAGPEARAAIRTLKASGLKTEPAFGLYFDLPGDPYQTLLALADGDDEALLSWYRQHMADSRHSAADIKLGKSGGC